MEQQWVFHPYLHPWSPNMQSRWAAWLKADAVSRTIGPPGLLIILSRISLDLGSSPHISRHISLFGKASEEAADAVHKGWRVGARWAVTGRMFGYSLEAAGAFRTSKVGGFRLWREKVFIVDVVHTVVEVSVKLI
jgi:hypothetical protein